MKKIVYVIMFVAIYLSMSSLSAKQKADKFCDSVQVGVPVDGLREKAIESGASAPYTKWKELGTEQEILSAFFSGYRPKSGFSCEITAKLGTVIRTQKDLLTEVNP